MAGRGRGAAFRGGCRGVLDSESEGYRSAVLLLLFGTEKRGFVERGAACYRNNMAQETEGPSPNYDSMS